MEGFGRPRKSAKVTADSTREKLNYDPVTGIFTWKIGTGKRWRGIQSGRPAGSARDRRGYRYLRIDGEEYTAHRLAWLLYYGEWPKGIIRFNDGDPSNCSIANLRDASVMPASTAKYNWRTKEGKAERQREYRATIQDKIRDYRMQREFGISLEKYNEMLAAQKGVCAICGNPETGKRNGKIRLLAIDHCHDSKKVRGLLCGNCNPMIGYAGERIEVLENAIVYLREHEKR